MMFPIEPGPEWTRAFGSDAGNWLSICNRLLHPNLSVNQFNLETLVTQLGAFEPKRKGSPKLVAAAAGILALIIIVGLWSLRPRSFNTELTSDPAGATILVDGVKQGGTTPLSLKLKAGNHRIEARLEEIGLSSQSTNWLAGKGTVPKVHFRFQYGNVVIESEPPGAAINKNGVSIGRTGLSGQPFQLTEIAPGPISFELKLDQYEPMVLQGIVSNAQTLELSAQLHRSEIAKTSEVHNVATNKVVQTTVTNPPPITNSAPVVSTGEIEFRAEPIAAYVFDPAGKELGQASPGSPLKRTLPAGKGIFVAKTQELGDVATELTVDPGGKTQHTFTFDYGTVDWASEPVSATVRSGAQSQTTPAAFIQRPQVTNSYVITAVGYQSQTNDVSIRSGEKRRLVAKLTPRGMSLALVSDPSGAEFLMEDGTPLVRDKNDSSLFSIPTGLKKIVARHPQLGLVTNQFELTQDFTATAPRFNFAYGTLVLTNFPPNLAVYEGDAKIGTLADQMVYQRAGNHRYTLRSQATAQDVQMLIQPGLNFFRFAVATPQTSWKNSVGMVFAWVPNLPGGGVWAGQSSSGGWVGVSEVTQGQYKKMDGSNPSAYREGGDNYPVENVTWEQAMNYCRWLSTSDTTDRSGWRYTLPTDDQFNAFAADSERLTRVTAEGRMSYSMDELFPTQRGGRVPTAPSATSARTHPEPVASTKQANQYGLYDVVGNVWEWLARSGGRENVYAGGSYLNFSQKTLGTRARERSLEKGPNIGFRVILVPAQ